MATVTKSIGASKDYATVTLWEAASYGATAADDAIGEVYGTVTESSAVPINDTTPLSIILRPATGEGHDGTKGTGATLKWSGAQTTAFSAAFSGQSITIEDLEFDGDGLDHKDFIRLDGVSGNALFTFQRNLIYDVSKNRSTTCAALYVLAGTNCNINNNVIFNIANSSTGKNSGIWLGTVHSTLLYNNTVYDISCDSGDATGISMQDDSDHIYKNNLVQNITANGTALDYSLDTLSNATSATNFSEDATSPDGASYRGITAVFTNAGAGDFNLEAGSDTILKSGGTDLDAVANVDLSGRDRNSEDDDWSGGALQFVAAGGSSILPIKRRREGI